MPFKRIARSIVRTLRGVHNEAAPSVAGKDLVSFRCNLCGAANAQPAAMLAREVPSCTRCGSTVRFRSMGHLIVRELLGKDTALPDLPVRRNLTGIGLSDAHAYADPLAAKFAYTNTYFHTDPRLDIANISGVMAGRYDFLIASDVFEHVVPPISRAFVNARRLLKPGGVFLFTVPFSLEPDTVEHFPELHEFRIADENGTWRLHNITADGRAQIFENLVFHGGPGSTLEMRLFSRAAIEREIAAAGFASMRIADESYPPFGIVWPEPWSVPIVAHA